MTVAVVVVQVATVVAVAVVVVQVATVVAVAVVVVQVATVVAVAVVVVQVATVVAVAVVVVQVAVVVVQVAVVVVQVAVVVAVAVCCGGFLQCWRAVRNGRRYTAKLLGLSPLHNSKLRVNGIDFMSCKNVTSFQVGIAVTTTSNPQFIYRDESRVGVCVGGGGGSCKICMKW